MSELQVQVCLKTLTLNDLLPLFYVLIITYLGQNLSEAIR
jgi:hypothetical protein